MAATPTAPAVCEERLPLVRHLKEAVLNAFRVLKIISKTCDRSAPLGESDQAAATTAMVVVLALNGFLGRAKACLPFFFGAAEDAVERAPRGVGPLDFGPRPCPDRQGSGLGRVPHPQDGDARGKSDGHDRD